MVTRGVIQTRVCLGDRPFKDRVFPAVLAPGPVNFDVNHRITGSVNRDGKVVEGEFIVTDAGFLPRFDLVGGDPGVLKIADRLAGMTLDEAAAALARRFYRFKDIEWVDFGKALALARQSGKPLHVVAIDGTLDDESC